MLIAFTAGIGEHASALRTQICEYFGYLGVTIDETENWKEEDYMIISTPDSKVKVMVIATNEELAICRETVALVK